MAEQNLGEWDARPVHPGFEPVRLVDDLFEVDDEALGRGEQAEALDEGHDDEGPPTEVDDRTDDDGRGVDDRSKDEPAAEGPASDGDTAADAGRAIGDPVDADPVDGEAFDASPLDADPVDGEALDAGPLDGDPIGGGAIDGDAIGDRLRPEPAVPLERSRLVPAPPDAEREWPLGRPPVFWLGVLVGLLPLVALVFGLIGYVIGRSGDDTVAVDTQATAAASTPAGADAGATTDPTSATVPAATATATDAAASPSPPGPEQLVASGLISDDTIELAGALPPQRQSQWSGEVRDLAAVLGLRLVDGTEVAEPGAGTAELTVRFPGAVVFTPESDVEFDGDADPVLGAVAGVLNRGTARLTIVAYADPSDPGAAILALSRAGHVHEQLVELGVEADRLAVESRPPAEAPIGVAGDVLDRRADVEFRFRS